MVSSIVIAGPTASGKSALAVEVAERLGGEIICADSRQVMADMPVATAAPTSEELSRVPHHNFGVAKTGEQYDAGRFVRDADHWVSDISARKKIPILVGGTGLYLRAWRYGMADVPAQSEPVRKALEAELARVGLPALYEELRLVDPGALEKIKSNDAMRVLRALEIFRLTGTPASKLRASHGQGEPRVHATWILLKPERAWLNQRLAQRTSAMFDQGLVEEAARFPGSTLMGHEEAHLFANGTLLRADAVERTLIRHRQYAKRQGTWFNKEPWWASVDLPRADLIETVMSIIGAVVTQK